MLRCTDCRKRLVEEEFSLNKNSKTGRNGRCRRCTSIAVKKWRKDNPERAAASHRKRLYGLSNETFIKMYESQEGKCASCSKDIPTFGRNVAVDHDHQTGQIRELLCHNCNDALGKLKDNPALVYKLFMYIIKHKAGD